MGKVLPAGQFFPSMMKNPCPWVIFGRHVEVSAVVFFVCRQGDFQLFIRLDRLLGGVPGRGRYFCGIYTSQRYGGLGFGSVGRRDPDLDSMFRPGRRAWPAGQCQDAGLFDEEAAFAIP